MDDKGQCSVCTEPWLTLKDESAGFQSHCYCPYIVDTQDAYKCKQCEQLIPGCSKCKLVSTPQANEANQFIGFDKILSDHYSRQTYVEVDNTSEPSHVVCIESSDDRLVSLEV